MLKENYVSDKINTILNQIFINYFNKQNNIWFSRSIKLFELYIPLFKYESLNSEIQSDSKYQLCRLIDSYVFLKDLNIISTIEFEKLESFLRLLPSFDYDSYKNNKNYIIPESGFENFGHLNGQIIIFVNNNYKVIIDIFLLEENIKNF